MAIDASLEGGSESASLTMTSVPCGDSRRPSARGTRRWAFQPGVRRRIDAVESVLVGETKLARCSVSRCIESVAISAMRRPRSVIVARLSRLGRRRAPDGVPRALKARRRRWRRTSSAGSSSCLER